MASQSSVRGEVAVDQASSHASLWREGAGDMGVPGYGGGTDHVRNGNLAMEPLDYPAVNVATAFARLGIHLRGQGGVSGGATGMVYKQSSTCEIEEEQPLSSPASPGEFGVTGNGTSSASEGSFGDRSVEGSVVGGRDLGGGNMILMRRPSQDEIRLAEEVSRLERAAIEAKLVAARKALGKEAHGKHVKEVKGLQTAEAQLRAIETKKQAEQARGLDMRSSLESLLNGMKGRGIISTTAPEDLHESFVLPRHGTEEQQHLAHMENSIQEPGVNNKLRLHGRETLSSGGGGQSPKTALDREALKDLQGGKKKGRLRFFSYTTGGSGKRGFGGTRP
eukprot:TRINITY_DN3314_c0_g2_i1.p1 TRINITY_DN3314_c0_g2~~TRINITY_DN3314_c0_g2_i1.p1  ORF type:complete len:335 (+),score=87.70 TRINITY_DN3314_c0_g2_i1:267-1271(+)